MRGTLRERFDAKWEPEPMTGCWLWTAGVNGKGYGNVCSGGRGAMLLSHRVSWAIHRGPIPTGLCVLHRCDTPACVNPAHLFLGTHLDNARDRHRKGRSGSHKGTKNGRAKVLEFQVLAIRDSDMTARQLAEIYPVCRGTVYDIRNKKTWVDL